MKCSSLHVFYNCPCARVINFRNATSINTVQMETTNVCFGMLMAK